MSTSYQVIIEKFAERHYIKSFEKKYKVTWQITVKALTQEFQSFDVLFQKSIAETIIDSEDVKICKTEFKISGTQESRKGSGNRCIVAIQKKDSAVQVLLVYAKTDIKGGHETKWWMSVIKENYPIYKDLF